MRSMLERNDIGRKMVERSSKRKLGFGDLCRYFRRSLSDDTEDDTANDVIWTVRTCYILTYIRPLDGDKDDRVLEDKQISL